MPGRPASATGHGCARAGGACARRTARARASARARPAGRGTGEGRRPPARFLDTKASSPSPASSLSKDSVDFFLSAFFSFLTTALGPAPRAPAAGAGAGAPPSLASSSESARFLRSWPFRLVNFCIATAPPPTVIPGPCSSPSSSIAPSVHATTHERCTVTAWACRHVLGIGWACRGRDWARRRCCAAVSRVRSRARALGASACLLRSAAPAVKRRVLSRAGLARSLRLRARPAGAMRRRRTDSTQTLWSRCGSSACSTAPTTSPRLASKSFSRRPARA